MAKRLAVASLMALIAALALQAGPANAAFKICNGSGKLSALAGTPTATWTVSGKGDCFGPVNSRELTFSGKGVSHGLGLCTGQLLVRNLRLTVKVTQTKTVTGFTKSELETWSSPYSLFPLATPFVITGGGGLGAGIVFHHINLKCGNFGTQPSAVFEFTTLT